jgi:hypothetical protein
VGASLSGLLVLSALLFAATVHGMEVREREVERRGADQPSQSDTAILPLVINTWPFTIATQRAWQILTESQGRGDVLTAVEKGVSACEDAQCDGTVGYGGSPNELGHTTLDAMIIDGDTIEMGSALNLHQVRTAISAARLVMEYTNHTILAGSSADDFAVEMGLTRESLDTNHSRALYTAWEANMCQPNYRRGDLSPDPQTSCGPYSLPPKKAKKTLHIMEGQKQVQESPKGHFGRNNVRSKKALWSSSFGNFLLRVLTQ